MLRVLMMIFNKYDYFVDNFNCDSGLYFNNDIHDSLAITLTFLFKKHCDTLNIKIDSTEYINSVQTAIFFYERFLTNLKKYIGNKEFTSNINEHNIYLITLIFLFFKLNPTNIKDFKKKIVDNIFLNKKVFKNVANTVENSNIYNLIIKY